MIISEWYWESQDTVLGAFSRVLSATPNKIFLDFSGDMYTYQEFDQMTNRLANSLLNIGIQPGETVASMLDNGIDAVASWFAINKIGAISVPLNTGLRGAFLQHQIIDSQAAIFICESEYLGRITEFSDGLDLVKLVLCRGEVKFDPKCKVTVAPFNEYRGENESPLSMISKPEDIACIIYTSGTTGLAKGSMQSHNFLCNIARQRLLINPASTEDITFTPMPLFHNNAIATGVVGTILSGGRIAIAPRFSVSAFWSEIERSGATINSMIGSMATLLANAPDNEFSIRCFGQIHTVRGVGFSDAIKAAWRTRFGAIHVGSNDYGMTEAHPITSLAANEFAAPDSSGKRNFEFDVRIVDEHDRELPVNTPGEIILRPLKPNIMFNGYWRRADATLNAFQNMWFHTGDIGKFDENGFFYFLDRKKDYLRRRGENISSYEMESAFKLHPEILEVAVHAVNLQTNEDEVKVTAVLKPGSTLTEIALCRWSIDKVPYYAVPRFIEFRKQLPKNTQDKVLKFQLRDEGYTPNTWDRTLSDIVVSKN